MNEVHDELALILASADTCLTHKLPKLEALTLRARKVDVELASRLHRLASAQRELYEFVENTYEFAADGLVRKRSISREQSEAEAECGVL